MNDETVTIIDGPQPNGPSVAVVTRDLIRKLIEEYLHNESPLRDAVRDLNVLPLSEETDERWYGVRPDGDLLSFNQRAPYVEVEEEDVWTRASVLSRSLEHYPQLEALVPPPPLSCRTCPRCRGTGVIVRADGEVLCICDGLGWLPPVSDEVDKRRPQQGKAVHHG